MTVRHCERHLKLHILKLVHKSSLESTVVPRTEKALLPPKQKRLFFFFLLCPILQNCLMKPVDTLYTTLYIYICLHYLFCDYLVFCVHIVCPRVTELIFCKVYQYSLTGFVRLGSDRCMLLLFLLLLLLLSSSSALIFLLVVLLMLYQPFLFPFACHDDLLIILIITLGFCIYW